MGFKSLANRATGKVGRQVLVAQKHSPAVLFVIGLVGVGTTAVLACRATLKMSEVLEEGEEHLKKVEVTVTEDDEEVKKASFSVKLQTAIEIAKLYAPAVILGFASVSALTGSHVILRKRNAGLAAAYAVVDRTLKGYRGRVIADQGKEKDFEYYFGLAEREIVEEGPNGPEVRTIKGIDAKDVKNKAGVSYARIFDEYNPNWSNVPNQNQYFVQSVQNHANDLLRVKGKVYLNDVYDMLGIDREEFGQVVGWVKNSETGDGYIDFGVWNGSTFAGKEWVTGNADGILLDFNVDGVVLDLLKKA